MKDDLLEVRRSQSRGSGTRLGSGVGSGSGSGWSDLPEIDLRQMLRMSDDTGIFQHAVYAVPDPNHGYCIDDNARALIAALLHSQLRKHDERVVPMHRYLTFLAYAYNEETRRFRNFMGYDRRWLESVGSQDSQGRTVWALGLAVELAPDEALRELALNLFERTVEAIEELDSLRARAFSLLGLEAYLRHRGGDERIAAMRDRMAEKLFGQYQRHATQDWPWWEDLVTYDNAKLPHAILLAGRSMGREDMVEAALNSLRWLISVQRVVRPDGTSHLSIIGNEGWLPRGGERAKFDQQPLEAYALVDACLAAAETGADEAVEIQGEERTWTGWAWWCFDWFLGRNDLDDSLFHPDTGGCQDGLLPTGVNKNQGAESVLAYLLSVLELRRFAKRHGEVAGRMGSARKKVVALWPGQLEGEPPTLELYPAGDVDPGPEGGAEGAVRGCVLVVPGGGYAMVSEREWNTVAAWMNRCGWDAAVLQYHVASTHAAPLHPAPLQDIARAVRLLRRHGEAWGMDTGRIAAMGFSAGGHLVASLSVYPDQFVSDDDDLAGKVSAKLDAAVLCYPVIDFTDDAVAHAGSRKNLIGDNAHPDLRRLMSPQLHVTEATPPTFLWHTLEDKGVPIQNALLYVNACHHAGVPVELHAYENGGHGLALAEDLPDVATWRGLCERFLRRHMPADEDV